MCSITNADFGDALEFAKNEWPKFYGKDTHLGFKESWETLFHRYSKRSDFFDLAIWQLIDGRQTLVALAIGNPSNAKTHLTIKWIERFFGNNYLSGRALLPILTCAEEYAKLLGSKRVLIKDPVDSAVYERYGYTAYHHPDIANGGNYFGKDLYDE
ncbi:hypothetical protein AB9F29_06095 [Falsihalocynthiibacter sp. S25ZX9]|uniref:hypothetical protein n=1 Tax=Falsihalocynthiibacter sp. S25ZX9 TaxID=3240870 RepID=UPI00350F04DA